MRIVITGGSGLIGGAVAREMGSAGHEVVVLTRDPSQGEEPCRRARAPSSGTARPARGWSVAARRRHRHRPPGRARASPTGAGPTSRKRRIRQSRVESGQAVMAAIRQAKSKPRVLLQGSAVGYYGACGDEVVDRGPPGRESDFLAEVCVDWEASTAEAEALGVRRPLLRTGIVLSATAAPCPDGPPLPAVAGGPLGSGRQWVPWIHLADEVGAIRFLLEREDAARPLQPERARAADQPRLRPRPRPGPEAAEPRARPRLRPSSRPRRDGRHAAPRPARGAAAAARAGLRLPLPGSRGSLAQPAPLSSTGSPQKRKRAAPWGRPSVVRLALPASRTARRR